MLKIPKGPFFQIFRYYETIKSSIFLFFENFSKTPMGSASIFLKFCNRIVVKKSQMAPFYSFRHCEISKGIVFVLKLGLLRPTGSTQYPIFVFFFKRPVFLYATLFVSIEAPLNFTRNETLCEHKRLLKVFGTMRLTGDLQKNFVFLQGFPLRKVGFCSFQLGKNGFRDAYPFGYVLGP